MRIAFPGETRPTKTQHDSAQERIAIDLRTDVYAIAAGIGVREMTQHYQQLLAAERYIMERASGAVGNGEVEYQQFFAKGKPIGNIIARVEPRVPTKAKKLVVGAHYDSVITGPGANDNTSAVAVGLALLRLVFNRGASIPVEFVFYANEEWPYFMTDECGSKVHAASCDPSEVRGMICLETIGCYDPCLRQNYPMPELARVMSGTADFVAFVGNMNSEAFTEELVRSFRASRKMPSEAICIPNEYEGGMPDAWRSDHAAYWQRGIPAVMVTDTADFRYRHYHEPTDTADRLCYDEMAALTVGLYDAISEMKP